MKKFVKTNIFLYLFSIICFMVGDYLIVREIIDNGYFFMIIFYFCVVVLILIAYNLSKYLLRQIINIYFRYVRIILCSCFLTLLLSYSTLIIMVNFHMAIGGSH